VLLMPLRPETQPLWRWRFQFPRQGLRALRIKQTARDPAAQWSIGEIHFLAEPRAQPNPWDIAWAFDKNPLTRWRSLAPLAPGMHIALDFKAVWAVDQLTLDCAHDQWNLRLQIEGQDVDGHWKLLTAEPQKSENPPLAYPRRQAMRELFARGITHLLLRDSDFGAADFRERTSVWGLRLLGRVEDWSLYDRDPTCEICANGYHGRSVP
jgi:hypothetical protein